MGALLTIIVVAIAAWVLLRAGRRGIDFFARRYRDARSWPRLLRSLRKAEEEKGLVEIVFRLCLSRPYVWTLLVAEKWLKKRVPFAKNSASLTILDETIIASTMPYKRSRWMGRILRRLRFFAR